MILDRTTPSDVGAPDMTPSGQPVTGVFTLPNCVTPDGSKVAYAVLDGILYAQCLVPPGHDAEIRQLLTAIAALHTKS